MSARARFKFNRPSLRAGELLGRGVMEGKAIDGSRMDLLQVVQVAFRHMLSDYCLVFQHRLSRDVTSGGGLALGRGVASAFGDIGLALQLCVAAGYIIDTGGGMAGLPASCDAASVTKSWRGEVTDISLRVSRLWRPAPRRPGAVADHHGLRFCRSGLNSLSWSARLGSLEIAVIKLQP